MGDPYQDGSGYAPRVAIIGYGPEAREEASRLRAKGWALDIVVRPGGMSWIHAVADGLRPVPPAEAVTRAEVVAIHLPESEQPALWACGIAPFLAPGSLVVFAHGSALYSGAVDPNPDLDVVLVSRERNPRGGCRIAVHRDATGRALERAADFARAAYSPSRIGTTTLESEVLAEISELVQRKGGLNALLAEWDRVLANPSHEPDEATLTYYERLRTAVLAGERYLRPSEVAKSSAGHAHFVFMARRRGAA